MFIKHLIVIDKQGGITLDVTAPVGEGSPEKVSFDFLFQI